jgi:hypothetical protein
MPTLNDSVYENQGSLDIFLESLLSQIYVEPTIKNFIRFFKIIFFQNVNLGPEGFLPKSYYLAENFYDTKIILHNDGWFP